MRKPETIGIIEHAPVGGGHLWYGKAMQEGLNDLGLRVTFLDPLVQGNFITRVAWKVIQKMYETGSQGGMWQSGYEMMRKYSGRGGFLLHLARAEMKQALQEYQGFRVADHSYVSHGNDYLIQSDTGTDDSYANNRSTIFVPNEQAAQQLKLYGHTKDIYTVGFFVPKKLASADPQKVIEHFKDGSIHVGFYGTGASPKPHFDFLRTVLLPQLALLIQKGKVKFTVYTFTNKKLAYEIAHQAMNEYPLRTVINDDDAPDSNWQVRILYGDTPYKAVERSIDALVYEDFVISMMGERTGLLKNKPMAPLKTVGLNTAANTRWAVSNGLIQPIETTHLVTDFLSDELVNGGQTITNRLTRAQEIVDNRGAIRAGGIIFQDQSPVVLSQ